ncbi:hypothetical protein D5F52_16000 [Brevibacillus laterosporus]|nr:hypothetical protein D5F52_16000 [Brevibacillus laterosporus]
MKYPQNENFISLQLFMTIQLIFLILGTTQFLNLMEMGRYLSLNKQPPLLNLYLICELSRRVLFISH